VALESPRLPALTSEAPAEFGGPGDRWSPETLVTGAVADCFVLTLRAVAQASGLPWTSVRCEVEGLLERVDRITRFTQFLLRVRLEVPPGTAEAAARRVLEKTEASCLVSRSLNASTRLEPQIVVSGAAAPRAA
jgi:organic hydroperoxide reductase OsmC/OhrA